MAEINENDLITQGAVDRPKELSHSFDEATASLVKLINTGKELGISIKGADSIKAIKTETNKLTQSQVELQKIEKQIEVTTARATKAYQDQQIVLQNLKKQQADRIILGQKDAKQVNELNSSVKQLEAALNKNRVAYKALADEEARSSKEGKELKEIIDQQDASVKKLNGGLGDFTDNVGNYEGSIKGLKLELRAARDEMAKIAATSGTTSKEFADASTKAGEIKDKINDLNDALKNSSQSKFENIGNSLKDVGSKLTSLDFEGASTSAKQFATVVKSLTFAEIIAGLEGLVVTLKTVAVAIFTNPLFILAGVLAGVGLALKYFIDQQEKESARTIERYKKEEEAAVSRYDKEIKLQKILGKQTFELEKDRQKIIAESADKQIEEITKRKQGIQEILKAGLTLAQATKFADEAEKILNDDKRKQVEELRKAKRDAVNEIEIITAEQAAFEKKTSADSLEQQKKDLFALNKFRLQVQAEGQEDIANNEKAFLFNRINAIEKFTILRNRIAKLERDEALSQEKLTSDAITLINEEYQNKILENKKSSAKQISALNQENLKKQSEDNALAENTVLLFQKRTIQNELEFAERRLDSEKTIIQEQARLRVRAGEDENKVKKETDEQLLKLERDLTDEYIQIQIDRVSKTLQLEGLGVEERAALEKELYDLKIKLANAFYTQIGDTSTKNNKTELQKTTELVANIQKIYADFANAIGNLFHSLSDARLATLDNESKKIQDNLDKELELAGTNEVEKERLRKKAAAEEAVIENKRRAEKVKTAKLDKALAIVNAGIQAGLAVLNALSTVKPYYLAVVAAVSAGVLGAVQIAAIAAAPIPAYEKGVKYKPKSGLAVVGEAGSELMILPGGGMQLTPSVASIMDVPRGTEIIPHKETMRRLALGALSQNGGTSHNNSTDPELLNEVKQLNYNIKNIRPARIPNLVRSGAVVYHAMKDTENHTKLVRSINLGKWV